MVQSSVFAVEVFQTHFTIFVRNFKGTGVIGLEENESATDDDQGKGA